MTDDAKKPAIRFAGFTDAWEQRELKELSDKVSEKNTLRAYKETFTNSAEFGIISQRDYFDHDISNVENLGNYYVVRDHDFVYNPRISTTAPVGPINRNKLGRIGVMSPLYTVFRTHNIDRTYLEHFFKSCYWHPYMQFNGDSGARSDRFSIKDSVFIEMPIPYPSIKEQKKIGSYLTLCDTQITLHQRKHDKLVNLKKSMLEKMFPQKGVDVPEIRFAGFADSWKTLRLGEDIANIIGGGTPSTTNPAYWDGDIDWYSPTEIGEKVYADSSEKKITTLGFQKSSAKMLPAGNTILFTSRAGIGDMAILRHPATTNQGFQSFIIKEVHDTYFIYSMGYLIKQYALQNASGSTFLEISAKMLAKMEVQIPSSAEQKKLGTFFRHIDTLITLHQLELEKLRNIKKSCLEKMFV